MKIWLSKYQRIVHIAVSAAGGCALIGLIVLIVLKNRLHFDISQIQDRIREYGIWGPLFCICLYAFFTLLFIPCTPLSIIVGITFGAIRGLAIASTGSMMGVAIAFLIARHGFHAHLQSWFSRSKTLAWINRGIESEGWRIIVISRMLPITPYNFLNYAYGLTNISFPTFLIASWVGILPPLIAVIWTAAAAGNLAGGKMDSKFVTLLLTATLVFVAVVYTPRMIMKRRKISLPQ